MREGKEGEGRLTIPSMALTKAENMSFPNFRVATECLLCQPQQCQGDQMERRQGETEGQSALPARPTDIESASLDSRTDDARLASQANSICPRSPPPPPGLAGGWELGHRVGSSRGHWKGGRVCTPRSVCLSWEAPGVQVCRAGSRLVTRWSPLGLLGEGRGVARLQGTAFLLAQSPLMSSPLPVASPLPPSPCPGDSTRTSGNSPRVHTDFGGNGNDY